MALLQDWDLVESFRQDAVVGETHTTHIQYRADRSRGLRKERVEKTWHRRKEIGRGSSGTVWLEVYGHDDVVEERAVKVISKSSLKHVSVDYKKELLALTKFSNDRYKQEEVLVKFFGWFEDPFNLFLSMEYFGLGDLEKYISESIAEDDIKDITKDILNGLRIMHSENFAHRDVKPSNIFVVQKPPESNWWVKIGDFGISKRAQDDMKLRTQIGTPAYQAPEVWGYLETAEPTSVYDTAVDIWSLGCVIYQIAMQTLLFPNPGDIVKFCNGGLQFPEQPLSAKLTMDGVEFLKKLIVPTPQKRLSAESALKASWLVQRKPDIVLKTEELTNRSTPKINKTDPNTNRDKPELYLQASEAETLSLQPIEITAGHSSNGDRAASASYNMLARLRDATAINVKMRMAHKGQVNTVAFSPDGRLVAAASGDWSVGLWDSATGVRRNTLRGHRYWVTAVAFSPNGNLLASASRDRTVILWDSATGAMHSRIRGESQAFAVAFSPNDNLIASAFDGTIGLWGFDTESTNKKLQGPQDRVTAVAFSPDGELVASASTDNTVRLWDAVTGVTIDTLEGHRDRVTAVAFSPDGGLLASASRDRTIQLWDSVTGRQRSVFRGHKGEVMGVAFSPDGSLIASASQDMTVGLWDSVTGKERSVFKGHESGILSVAFSPDGNLVASASRDCTIKRWAVHDRTYPTLKPLLIPSSPPSSPGSLRPPPAPTTPCFPTNIWRIH